MRDKRLEVIQESDLCESVLEVSDGFVKVRGTKREKSCVSSA